MSTNEPLDPWAPSGVKSEPSPAKKNIGWEQEERPPFEFFNWWWAEVTDRLNFLYANTSQPWRADIDYPTAGQMVKGSDNAIYVSVQATGPSTTVQNPNTDATDTYWQLLQDYLNLGSMADKDTGTGGSQYRNNTQNDARFVIGQAGTGGTQTRNNQQNDDRFCLESNNLSDVANAATAFNNIKQNATTGDTGVVEKATPTEMSSGGTDKFPDCPTIRSYVGQELGALEYAKFGMIGSSLVSSGRVGILTSGVDRVSSVLFFNNGFSAYMFGETIATSELHIWQMNLTDRFNLANATQVAKINLGVSGSLESGKLHLQPDGSRLFLAARQFMYSYTMSTPFDITTLVAEHLESINMFDCNGAQFAADGSYFIGGGDPTSGFAGLTYTPLGTNWDISTQGAHVDVDLEASDNITFIENISILKTKKDNRDHVAFTGIFNDGGGNVGKYYEFSFANGFDGAGNADIVEASRDMIPRGTNGINDIDNQLGVYVCLNGVLFDVYTFAKPIVP